MAYIIRSIQKKYTLLFFLAFVLVACHNDKRAVMKNNIYELSLSERNTDSLNPKHASFIKMINALLQQDLSPYRNLSIIQLKSHRGDTFFILGWIKSQQADTLKLISIYGGENQVTQSNILKIKKIKAGRDFLKNIKSIYSNPAQIINAHVEIMTYTKVPPLRYLFLASWLHQRKEFKVLNKLMDSLTVRKVDNDHLQHYVGDIYFDYLLKGFSVDRDFEAAKRYAGYLAAPVFHGYNYRETATRISNQIKGGKILYDSYPFPDSIQWSKMKQTMSRALQFDYLIKKLNLLNYVQLGQPGGIDYNMPQTRLPYLKMFEDTTIKDDKDLEKYYVINPFEEIIKLKPTKAELIQLAVLLDDSTFIPAYSYFRDFFPGRTVHRVNWVVAELINQIEHRRFWGEFDLYNATYQDIDHKIEKIKLWIKTLK